MRYCSALTTRTWTVALIICLSLITSKCQDLKKLDNVFHESTLSQPTTVDNLKCNDIHGSIRGCYDCYLCSEPQITNRVNKDNIITPITMIDNTCSATDICCIHQNDLVPREKTKCGVSNPEGYYPAVRNSLRSVLPGEYPWRAWVYSSNSKNAKPLCSATYISLEFEAQALITSATCVSPFVDDKLYVRFSESGAFLEVDQKVIHENFKLEFHYNDIALLILKSLETAPKWVSPCCLPTEAPRFGTPCIAVSADNRYINAGIPHEKHCRVDDVPMHESHMCAVAPRYDYTPETGSALICLEEQERSPIYIAYGIALHKSGDEITMYTNVKNFCDWIKTQIEKKQNTINSYNSRYNS